jgi:hypothetical protein
MKLPFPSVNFSKLVQKAMSVQSMPLQVLSYDQSGEVTSSVIGQPIGTVLADGVLSDFVVSLANQGRDDTNDLSLSVDLLLNGASVLSTPVVLIGASGEAGAHLVGDLPTFSTTDVERGDILTANYTLTRTASPTTEMNTLCSSVKIIPVELV